MPLATAITSRAGGRSLAMALRTQNFVGHFLLPPVSPHEDMGRRRNIHNSLDEPSRTAGAPAYVCFTPESGHVQCKHRCPLWAKSGHQASNANMRFQSSFMLITVQAFFFASS